MAEAQEIVAEARSDVAKEGKTGRHLVSQEIATLIAEFRSHWLQPLERPMRRAKRFAYGLAGSVTWVLGTSLTRLQDEAMLNLWFFAYPEPVFWITMTLAVPIPLWFAWLVSWRERPVGPIRLFLDGIILPTVVAFLLSF